MRFASQTNLYVFDTVWSKHIKKAMYSLKHQSIIRKEFLYCSFDGYFHILSRLQQRIFVDIHLQFSINNIYKDIIHSEAMLAFKVVLKCILLT